MTVFHSKLAAVTVKSQQGFLKGVLLTVPAVMCRGRQLVA